VEQWLYQKRSIVVFLWSLTIRLRKILAEEAQEEAEEIFVESKVILTNCLSQWLVVGFSPSHRHTLLICHGDIGGK
jgi:hypothetical protein